MSQSKGEPDVKNRKRSFLSLVKNITAILGVPLSAALLIAIASVFFFGWIAGEVLEGDTQRFDDAVLVDVHRLATPVLTRVMKITTNLGSTLFLVTLGICVAAAFIYTRHRRALILFAVTMAGAVILNFSLKSSFQRARPEPYFNTPLESSFSFPSGHALFSLCFYSILAWLITSRIQKRSLQICIWTAAVLLVLSIGFSRIYLGMHYPSDVIAGYAAAFVWIIAVSFGDFWLMYRSGLKEKQ
jgi:undecaprenyl-diphosphatase